MKTTRYIPTYIYPCVTEIDYARLKAAGITLLLFDVDNTLAPYHVKSASKEVKELFARLRGMGFTLMICTNNTRARALRFLDGEECAIVALALKPWTLGIRRALKSARCAREAAALIGDQLKTDVACANRAGIASVLVASLDRSNEPFYTRLNRSNEARIIARMKELDPKKAEAIEALHD